VVEGYGDLKLALKVGVIGVVSITQIVVTQENQMIVLVFKQIAFFSHD